MKQFVIAFLHLLICISGFSQNTFFKWFETSSHEAAYDAVQTSKGEYLIVGEKGIDFYSMHSFILKIGIEGSILDEKEFPCTNCNSRIITIDKLPGSDNRFLLTGAQDSVSGNYYYSRLFLMIINDSLEIISSKEFFTKKNRRFNPWKTSILSESIFYLLTSCDTLSKNRFLGDMEVIKFRIPFDSISSFHHQSNIPSFIPQDIFFNNRDKTLHVYYFGNDMSKRSSTIKVLKLSEDLEYISCEHIPGDIFVNVSASKINDSLSYVTGVNHTTITETYRDIGCYLLNDANGIIKSIEFFNDPDTLIYSGRGGYCLLTNTQTLHAFIISIYNLDIGEYPWQTTPAWIQITRTDFDLNIIDHHFYGGDASYMVYSTKPTCDGGSFITGFRYDYQNQGNQQHDIFILKTDSAGRLTDVPEISKELVSEAILAPTPGMDYCFAIVAQQYQSVNLLIYNINGIPVIDQLLHGPITKITTDNLPKGIYLYKFFDGNKVIGTGKWIKL